MLTLIIALMLLLVGCGSDGGEEEDAGDTADETAVEEPEEEPAGGEEAEDAEDAAGGPPAEPVTIRLGWYTPGQEFAYVVQHLPEVAPNLGTWYEIEWTQFPPQQAAQSIAGGTVDGTVIASVAAATLLDQGVDIVVTGVPIAEKPPHRPLTWLVRSDSGINSPADLAGQTVGTIGEGTFADRVADHVIGADGGLEAGQDYEKTVVQFPVMMEALLSGQIAAGPFPPPFLQQTMATGEAQELFTTYDALPELVVTLMVFRRDFVDENMAAMEAFVEDWAAVYQWVQDPANRDQAVDAVSAATEVPAEALAGYLLTEEDGHRPANGAVDQDSLQATWDFFREQGAFSAELNVADHVIEDLLPPEG